MKFPIKSEYVSYVRDFIFGVEDSLVSTVGLLSGIAAADTSRHTIVLTGIVLIFVEAFSMGVGSYLSENTTANYKTGSSRWRIPVIGGVVMLVSYIIAGIIPIVPYMVVGGPSAFWWSIACSLVGLVALGWLAGRLLGSRRPRHSVRMLLLGGTAIAIGVIVGNAVRK